MSSSSFLGGYNYNPANLVSKGGIQNALSNQYGNNSALQSQTNDQRTGESGTLLSGYQGLVSGGGYSPIEKANIEQGTLGGVQSGYNSAADAIQRNQAITHNQAGTGSVLSQLGRQKAQDLSQAGLQVQSQFANEAYQRKLQGLQGLAQMYGVDTSFLNSLNNSQTGLIAQGSGVQSRSKGVLGTIGGILSLPSTLFGNSSSGPGKYF